MKKRMATIIMATGLCATLMLSGCVSAPQGTEESRAASQTMETVEGDIRLVVININTAGQALASLISPTQENATKAFESYSASVDALVYSSDIYIEHSDKMGVQGMGYFDEWTVQGATYVNPGIQSLSKQRRDEISSVFAKIIETSVEVRSVLSSHVIKLQDIRIYASTDLTQRGAQVITPVALDAIANGFALSNALEGVLGSISSVRYELAAGDTR